MQRATEGGLLVGVFGAPGRNRTIDTRILISGIKGDAVSEPQRRETWQTILSLPKKM
jgi:hypothetical protein